MNPEDILDYEPRKPTLIENIALNVFSGVTVYMMQAPFTNTRGDFITRLRDYDDGLSTFMFVVGGITSVLALIIAFINIKGISEGQKYFAFIINGIGILFFIWWLIVVNFLI